MVFLCNVRSGLLNQKWNAFYWWPLALVAFKLFSPPAGSSFGPGPVGLRGGRISAAQGHDCSVWDLLAHSRYMTLCW